MGGLGGVTKKTQSATLLNGFQFTDEYGEQTVLVGGGCPLCGTKNGVREGIE